jgi:hypothetical protein
MEPNTKLFMEEIQVMRVEMKEGHRPRVHQQPSHQVHRCRAEVRRASHRAGDGGSGVRQVLHRLETRDRVIHLLLQVGAHKAEHLL